MAAPATVASLFNKGVVCAKCLSMAECLKNPQGIGFPFQTRPFVCGLCARCKCVLLRVKRCLSQHTGCLSGLCSVGLIMMMCACERHRAVFVRALLKLLCARVLHVHRDLCHPLKTSDPLVSAWLFADDRKINNKTFFSRRPGISKYCSYLREVWKRRPTMMPFEMPQLSSAE